MPLVALPLLLPPTVLGFYILLALGPRSPLGASTLSLTGGMLPFSFPGLLIGSVLVQPAFHGAARGRRFRRGGPETTPRPPGASACRAPPHSGA